MAIEHEPSGLLIIQKGEGCPACGYKGLTLTSLTTSERMDLRIGRYLLMRCVQCGKECLLERSKPKLRG